MVGDNTFHCLINNNRVSSNLLGDIADYASHRQPRHQFGKPHQNYTKLHSIQKQQEASSLSLPTLPPSCGGNDSSSLGCGHSFPAAPSKMEFKRKMIIVHHHLQTPRIIPELPQRPIWDAGSRRIMAREKIKSQFLIEPHLNRNSTSIKVMTAKAHHLRNSQRISSLIIQSSSLLYDAYGYQPQNKKLLEIPLVSATFLPVSTFIPLDGEVSPNCCAVGYCKNETTDCPSPVNSSMIEQTTRNRSTNWFLEGLKRVFNFGSDDSSEKLYLLESSKSGSEKDQQAKKLLFGENKIKKDFEANSKNYSFMSLCPEIPPSLKGHQKVNLEKLLKTNISQILSDLSWVKQGGKWSPVYDTYNPCLPRHKVAVIIPYRDRLQHLLVLLYWLHPILRRQQLQYTIYVPEQFGNLTFNKGMIMNAGFLEAWAKSSSDCFVFHDVDLLPEDDRNMYSCPQQPRHLSVAVDTFDYKLPYKILVGGVLNLRGEHFLRVNGFSNMYWGWGGEDDDLGHRLLRSGFLITRPPSRTARYTMIKHEKRKPLTWTVRGKLVKTSSQRFPYDGLTTLKYKLKEFHQHLLFTHFLIDVGSPPKSVMKLDKS